MGSKFDTFVALSYNTQVLLFKGGILIMKNVKNNFKRCFSNGPKTFFVVMLVLTCITATLFNMKKAISIVVDGKSIEVITLKSNVTQILKTNNIALGAKDQITVSLDSKVKDGDKIYIKKAVEVKLTVDGKELNLKTAESTVEDMLRAEKIVLNNEDKIIPSKSTLLESGIQVQITRVKTKILEETKTIDFTTEFKNSSDLNKGVKKVIQKGQTGQKLITSAIVYENGKESSRKLITEELKSNPVKEIIALGTTSVYSSSRGGDISYIKKIRVRATAYNADYRSTGKNPGDPGFGITSTGVKADRNTNGYSTVAVDPRVIPLGTKFYVEGYGYGIAEDIGGAIKGNRIDLYYDTLSQSMNWGSRNVDIYILK
ncbi:MAG: DUF348 domain-containing protein [Clostridium sp.]|nr:DUF348 domain-containing protein [Clostridium sp.]